ncbi:MAG: hypothetical protein M1832_004390 [Thelocarpon impressellum]|nr:MAG: hypothetical protein M1832_004390 [Thelocarpon impressellum]
MMGFLDSVKGRLTRKESFSRKDSSSSRSTTSDRGMGSSERAGEQGANVFFSPDSVSAPSRRPAGREPGEAPPPYSPAAATATSEDDPYAFLTTFNTVVLLDDSGSMAGRSWRETAAALATIAPICTSHDADGVDVHFLNAPDVPEARNMRSAAEVEQLFRRVRPSGSTPTGRRLHELLGPYLRAYEAAPATTKPLNIIVITDGAASDDVESVLVAAARRLDRVEAPAWQVGVQFFQVGAEPAAKAALEELDEELGRIAGVRDIVDTVPWSGASGVGLNGEGILKVVLGAVLRRLDRKRDSREWRPRS